VTIKKGVTMGTRDASGVLGGYEVLLLVFCLVKFILSLNIRTNKKIIKFH